MQKGLCDIFVLMHLVNGDTLVGYVSEVWSKPSTTQLVTITNDSISMVRVLAPAKFV